MAEYNADVLVKVADDLYAKARSIVGSMTIVGGLGGLVVGGVVNAAVGAATIVGKGKTGPGESALIVVGVVAVVGAVLGFATGQSRALAFKAQAQQLLCQVQVERHLAELVKRGASAPSSSSPPSS
jgi:hypothetical protein